MAHTTTVIVRVPLLDIQRKGWLGHMVRVIKKLKAEGVPVVGRTTIRYVEHGLFTQRQDLETGECVFHWTGEIQPSDIAGDLI